MRLRPKKIAQHYSGKLPANLDDDCRLNVSASWQPFLDGNSVH